MSDKHDMSDEAKALRYVAYGEESLSVMPHQRPRWNQLKRAALAYARRVLAGQCIPKKEK